MSDDIQSFVVKKLASKMNLSQAELLSAPNLFEVGLDSFSFTQLVSEIEKKYAFSFTEKELMSPEFQNAPGICSLIRNKLVKKAA